MHEKLASSTYGEWASAVLAAMERLVVLHGALHMEMHAVHGLYRLTYGEFIQPVQLMLRWKRIRRNTIICHRQATSLMTFIYWELSRSLVLTFAKSLDITNNTDEVCACTATGEVVFFQVCDIGNKDQDVIMNALIDLLQQYYVERLNLGGIPRFCAQVWKAMGNILLFHDSVGGGKSVLQEYLMNVSESEEGVNGIV